MTEISADEALAEMRKYGTAVHCELYRNMERWKSDSSDKYYYDRGCTIVVSDYEYKNRRFMWYRVHQTSPEADIDTVTADWKAKFDAEAAKYDNPNASIVSFVVSNGELTPEKNQYYGWRNYSRRGQACETDGRVRIMTAADTALMDEACRPSLENDTNFGKSLAQNFTGYDFEQYGGENGVYGLFEDGKLAAIASCTYVKTLELAWLLDIFVLPEYRQRGIGSALVLSALSAYPDKKWHYQAARDNAPSIALAKSLGFTLEGAGLYV